MVMVRIFSPPLELLLLHRATFLRSFAILLHHLTITVRVRLSVRVNAKVLRGNAKVLQGDAKSIARERKI